MSDIQAIRDRADAIAKRYRDSGANNDRVNRFCGRAEVIITKLAARKGETIPTLYVSGDGRTLQTWPGNHIAALTVTGKVHGFNGTRLTCYSAVIEGRRYYGRGLGNGMCINLRPAKRANGSVVS
jgi:hypothetical protein